MRRISKVFVKQGYFQYEDKVKRREKSVRTGLYLSLSVACFLVFFAVSNAVPIPQPPDQNRHVLIINSYHKGYPWTDNVLAGIESVLKDGKSNITLHIEFMDTKRVADKNYFYHLFLYYRSKFEKVRFDLIIVSNKDALNFAMRYRDLLFPKIPVVFCGVDAQNEILRQKAPLVTGVLEDFDIKATLDIALKLHPNTREIIAINDGTAIGAVKKQIFKDALAATGKNLIATIIDDPVLEDFEKLLKDKDKDFVVILMGSFRESSGAAVPIEVSTPILTRYNIPLYALVEYYLGYGIIGGKLISGFHQGMLAAKMGLKILQGEPVDRIPVEHKSQNMFMFDYNQLMKFGINQDTLPEGSIIINEPKPVPSEDKKIKWEVIAVPFSLAIIATFLVLYLLSRKRQEELLDKLSRDHEKKIEARTEELMKSNTDLKLKITEMKQAEAGLVEERLKHLTLFQRAPSPFFVVNRDYRYSDFNEKMVELFECTLEEFRKMDASNLIPKKLLARLFESQGPVNKMESFETQLEVRGKTKRFLFSLVPVVLSGEKFVYGVGQDMTQLIQSQDISKQQEKLLEKLFEVLPDAAIISDREGTIKYVSEGFFKVFGFSRDDFQSIDAWLQKVCSDESLRDVAMNAWLRAVKTRNIGEEILQPIEGKLATKDGASLELELWFIPMDDMVVSLIRDITRKKVYGERVPVSRNQESVETLAAGIAHDFNNLLLVILGNISLAKTSLTREDKAFEHLIDAEKASMMTKDLIQQLITFSKGGELSKRAMVITSLVMEITRSTLSNSNIRGKYTMSDDLFPVEVDEGQIRQVVHIILRNAMEAMPQGGTVAISFENVKVSREDYLPLKQGDYVKISFQDQGSGIKKEHLERIFDPYFTTKDAGSQKGVGLGLAIAYSIVKKHGGHIAVESSLVRGTIFHIYLPAFGKDVIHDNDLTETAEAVMKKKGKILVMDDAKSVRDVTGAMLSYMGYDVEFAREGREAVAIYRAAKESGEPFDAVILDLTVSGGMGGKETIELLIALDPHIKAIISSGFSGDPIMSEYQEYGFKTAILKPYKMEELEEVLERLIHDSDLKNL